MKTILLMFFLTLSLSANGSNNLSFEEDKKLHLGVSFLISGVSETILEKTTISNKEKFIYSTAFSLSIGIIKEIKDSQEINNYFSLADLTYDFIGSLSGAATSYYIHRYFDKNTNVNLSNKQINISYSF